MASLTSTTLRALRIANVSKPRFPLSKITTAYRQYSASPPPPLRKGHDPEKLDPSATTDEKGRRYPPPPPERENENLTQGDESPSFLGTKKRLPEFNLTDRVVLVSGGARGLGLTQAEALMEAGATVYVLDRLPDPSDEFYEVRNRGHNNLGTEIHYRQIDVTDDVNLREIVHNIGEKHGRLDGLIAAAGINKEGDSLEFSTADFNRILEVNVTGVFATAQAVAKEMVHRGNGGSMAFIASMSGTIANRGLICAAYNASKSAVVQLARNLAMEWGSHGIRVNTISPGYIVTPLTEHDFKSSPERERFLADGNMLRRLSETREYRGAAVFLISGASSFMTGSDLIIDGGHHAW